MYKQERTKINFRKMFGLKGQDGGLDSYEMRWRAVNDEKKREEMVWVEKRQEQKEEAVWMEKERKSPQKEWRPRVKPDVKKKITQIWVEKDAKPGYRYLEQPAQWTTWR